MDQTAVDPAQVQHIMAAMVPILGLIGIIIIALLIVPFWFAFKKAGLSPWLSLLVLVPGIGLLLTLYVLAFARWRVVPMAPEYPAYPANGYPPQNYVQQTSYPSPPTAYPPPSTAAAAAYPPTDPSSGV